MPKILTKILIDANSLTKTFQVQERGSTVKDYVQSLFKPTYIEKKALDNVSLTVNEGEIIGLVGANGAGKTTLIKLLAGIVYPTSGTATVLDEIPWNRSNSLRKRIALVMGQKAQLWWDLPANDGFLLLKEIYQISDKEFHERKSELLKTLNLDSLVNTPIRKLSLGERMKMELVAALLHSPKVLYLDEPTIGLDFASQKAIRKFILSYVKSYNPAVILTSHYMEDIKELCERIVIIRSGSIVYDGLLSGLEKHTQNKLIRISEDISSTIFKDIQNISIKSQDGETIIHSKQEKLPEVMAGLIKNKITNFTVENEDIAEVIQSLMTKS